MNFSTDTLALAQREAALGHAMAAAVEAGGLAEE